MAPYHHVFVMASQEEAFQRLQRSNQDLMDLAVNGTSQIEKYCFLATSSVGDPLPPKKNPSSEGTKKRLGKQSWESKGTP